MKKLLLSSIIMFGVCSFATAQNVATGSKLQKASATSSSISPAPQKSVVATGSETIVGDDGVARPAASNQAVAAKTADVVAVDAAGGTTVTAEQIAKKKEMQKASETKPARVKKPNQN